MSLALWRALTAAIERLEADPEVGYFTGWPMMLSECAHHACYLLPSAVSGAAQRCPSLTGHSISRLFAAAQVRGVIIASGLRRPIFTAGQDLREIYAPLTTKEATRSVLACCTPVAEVACVFRVTRNARPAAC